MSAAHESSPTALCEAILAAARQKAEESIRRARARAEALVAQASAEAEASRRDRLNQARAEAVRRREVLLAAVPVGVARLRSARIEALLQSVHDEARRRLLAREGFDYRECLVRLAAEAIRQMAGDVFIVTLSPDDHRTHGAGLAEDIALRAGRSSPSVTLMDDATVRDGVVVQDAGGRQVWDDRLPVRLARLWPDLRWQVAVRAGLLAATTGAP